MKYVDSKGVSFDIDDLQVQEEFDCEDLRNKKGEQIHVDEYVITPWRDGGKYKEKHDVIRIGDKYFGKYVSAWGTYYDYHTWEYGTAYEVVRRERSEYYYEKLEQN
ncbi:MAG: hypothetical protein ACRCWQ_13780 [Bacilli bacterium]